MRASIVAGVAISPSTLATPRRTQGSAAGSESAASSGVTISSPRPARPARAALRVRGAASDAIAACTRAGCGSRAALRAAAAATSSRGWEMSSSRMRSTEGWPGTSPAAIANSRAPAPPSVPASYCRSSFSKRGVAMRSDRGASKSLKRQSKAAERTFVDSESRRGMRTSRARGAAFRARSRAAARRTAASGSSSRARTASSFERPGARDSDRSARARRRGFSCSMRPYSSGESASTSSGVAPRRTSKANATLSGRSSRSASRARASAPTSAIDTKVPRRLAKRPSKDSARLVTYDFRTLRKASSRTPARPTPTIPRMMSRPMIETLARTSEGIAMSTPESAFPSPFSTATSMYDFALSLMSSGTGT